MAFPFDKNFRDEKRYEMTDGMVIYTQKHADMILAMEADSNFKPKPLAPYLNTCTTGLGKSNSVDYINSVLMPYGLPLLVVVQNHKIAREYAERIPGSHVFFGKQVTLEQWSTLGKKGAHPSPKSICYKIEISQKAADKQHRPGADLCKNKCEFGKAGAAKFGRDPDRVGEARQWLINNKYPINTPHCPYLYEGMVEARAARVLIMPIQAFSDSFATFEIKNEYGVVINSLPRLVVFDEKVEVTKEVQIKTGDISGWIDELPKLKQELAGNAARLIWSAYRKLDKTKLKDEAKFENEVGELVDMFKDKDVIENKKQIMPLYIKFITACGSNENIDEIKNTVRLLFILRIIRKMFNALILSITLNKPIPAARILSIYNIAKSSGAFVRGTAKWEQISFVAGQYTIPLRALQLLASNLEINTSRKVDNGLFVYEVTPPVEWALAHGSTIFLDATATPQMRDLIQAMGGQQFDALVGQNMRVVRVVGKNYGKGKAETREEKIAAALKRYDEAKEIAAQLVAKSGNRKCAILIDKQTLQYSHIQPDDEDAAAKQAELFYQETGAKIGWFNLHDRAQNEWAGYNLAIVGMERIPHQVMVSEYHKARVALKFCGKEWPEWNGELDNDYLPSSKHARQMVISRFAGNLVQAIGRARAVNHESGEPLLIELWGGLQSEEMDAALFGLGIEISERVTNTLHLDKTGYYNRTTNLDVIDKAADDLVSTGRNPSVRSVIDRLKEMGGKAARDAVASRLAERVKNGTLPAPKFGRPSVSF